MNLEKIFSPRRRRKAPRLQTVVSKKIGKLIAAIILAGVAALFGLNKQVSPKHLSTSTLSQALQNKRPLNFVEINDALVVKVLKNDTQGSRHQRWLMRTASGELITAIYNIDVAEEIPLKTGDTISLAGELIFGSRKKDPIIHWLHSDPEKKRPDGYIIYAGKKYGS